jgi:hypothetical protein
MLSVPCAVKKKGSNMQTLMKWAKRVGVACQTQQRLTLVFLDFLILINDFFIYFFKT